MRHITQESLKNLRLYYLSEFLDLAYEHCSFRRAHKLDYCHSVLTSLVSDGEWVVKGDKPVRQLLAQGIPFACGIQEHGTNNIVLKVELHGSAGLVHITRVMAAPLPVVDLES